MLDGYGLTEMMRREPIVSTKVAIMSTQLGSDSVQGHNSYGG